MKNIRNIDVRLSVIDKPDVESITDEFYIFESSNKRYSAYPFKTDVCLCCLCIQGEAEGRINLSDQSLRRQALLISMPGNILEITRVSDDFMCVCIIMTERFIANLGLPFKLGVHRSVLETPVVVLADRQFESMKNYCRMVRRVLKECHPNSREILKHLTCAFFYGIGYYFHQATDKALSNEEDIMRRFLDEVQSSCRSERKVIYYAGKLHLTAKYLSSVVKGYSGKTASEWIDEYVVLEAKALLKSTNLTVQQISEELHFPSQSFFGKYFKRLTGMSPKYYRNTGISSSSE